MKRLFLPVFILTMVLVLSGIWVYQTGTPKHASLFRVSEIIHVAVIALFLILGVVFSVGRIKSREKGFPEEDELSKRVVQKAAVNAFYVSLFLWLAVLRIQSTTALESGVLFSYGFIGTALVFLISWVVLNGRGIKDE